MCCARTPLLWAGGVRCRKWSRAEASGQRRGPPRGGGQTISALFLLPSGPSLWDQGSQSGCLPPALPHPSPPCLSTHPSICLSAADLCVHAVLPGLARGRAPSLLGGVCWAHWLQPLQPREGPLAPCTEPAWGPRLLLSPGAWGSAGFSASCPEWDWPAGQALGWMRGDWWLRRRGARPGEGGGVSPPACPACCPPAPACQARLRPHLAGFSFFVETLSFICLFSFSLLTPFLFLFFSFFLFFLLSSVLCTQAAH